MTDSAGTSRHRNHLAGESSPYLLLHADNPVDWYPWGPEALARAHEEDKPIFLSVGYSTCYWCHVMERESFSSPQVAELMNRWYVSIKVDREEHPELDEIYMAATQLMTGQGGWPNSVFLTPDLRPFYAGTYFPPDDRHGRPGFGTVLENLHHAWMERRPQVETQAERVAAAMQQYLEMRPEPLAQVPGTGLLERGVGGLEGSFDREWGGFGRAPKFPTPANLFLLLEAAPEDPRAGEMLATTLDAMARGGIYDQLAGGFHRYATDREWKVPHFEKMLYDNGLLLEVYARAWELDSRPQWARIARQTAAFVARELTGPDGELWSAIDAETDGTEGAYYVWTRAEVEAALGEEDAAWLAPVFGLDGPPSFEGSHYVLHHPEPLDERAEEAGLSPEDLRARFDRLRERLLEARGERQRPLTDDKVLADWNGLAIAGLAVAGRILDDPAMVEQATRAASFVLRELKRETGPLHHAWRAGMGEASVEAFLADYAYFVHGLLALHRATGEGRWLSAARSLAMEQADRLEDPRGGFWVTEERADVLFRSKEILDGALPSANAVAVLDLLELARRTGEERWWASAERAIRAFGGLLRDHPEGVRTLAVAAARFRQLAPARSGEGSEVVRATLHLEAPESGGWRPFRVELAIAEGWHLNAHPASLDYLVATRVEGDRAEVRGVSYPQAELRSLGFSGEELAVYEDLAEVVGEVKGGEIGAALRVTYQVCDDRRCLPPVTERLELSTE